MENRRISRRSLFGGLAAAALSSAVPGRVARADEGDVELPREGSYINGRKVVYIDGSSGTDLTVPYIHNVVVEPVNRNGDNGYNILEDNVSLDLRYAVTGNGKGIGALIRGRNAEIINGSFSNFDIGINGKGKNTKIDSVSACQNNYGFLLEDAEGNRLTNVQANLNRVVGIQLEPSYGTRVSNFTAHENRFYGVNAMGEDNHFSGGLITGLNPINSNSVKNTFLDCITYDPDSAGFTGVRQFTFNPTFVDRNGRALNDALVSLRRFNGAPAFTLWTDANGNLLTAVPVTTYVSRNGVKEDFAPFAGTVETLDGKAIPFVWQGNSKMVDETIQLD